MKKRKEKENTVFNTVFQIRLLYFAYVLLVKVFLRLAGMYSELGTTRHLFAESRYGIALGKLCTFLYPMADSKIKLA